MSNPGCACDPPGDGTLVLAIRTWVPLPPRPTLSGGEGETLDGLTSLLAIVERVDVVHRTNLSDASTEQVLTIGEGPEMLELTGSLEIASPRAVGEFLVPAGFVLQIRLVTSALTLSIRGEEHSVALTSADQSGFKIDPVDEVPFEIRSGEDTGARVVFEPFEQLIRNRGVGFLAKPHLVAEYVTMEDITPGPVLLDEVVVRFAEGTPSSSIDADIAAVDATVVSSWPPHNRYRLKLPPTMSYREGLDHFDALPTVANALPSFVLSFNQPNDPEYVAGNQPQWVQAGVDAAYVLGYTGSYAPIVAIIDSGVNYEHEDLINNIWINVAEVDPALGADADGDGCPDGDFDLDCILTFADLNMTPLTAAQDMLLTSIGLPPPADPAAPRVTPEALRAVSANLNDEDPCGGVSYVDDVIGWNFEDGGDGMPLPDYALAMAQPTWQRHIYHGHYMASKGAEGNNDMHLSGVPWKVRIMPLRVEMLSWSLGTATSRGPIEASVYEAIQYAICQGATVINLSAGAYISTRGDRGCKYSFRGNLTEETFMNWVSRLDAEMAMQLESLRSGGTLLVNSAGNCRENHDDPTLYWWPGGRGNFFLPGPGAPLLRVAAVEADDSLWVHSSNLGSDFGATTVDLAAPGTNWVALSPELNDAMSGICDGSDECDGTSGAGAFTSFVAALVAGEDPALLGQPCELADRIVRNGTFVGGLVAGDVVGMGYRVNAVDAILDTVTAPVRAPCP